MLELLGLRIEGDASRLLARALIATKLNIAAGSDPAPIADTVEEADELLSGFAGTLPFGIPISSEAGINAVLLSVTLELYNLGVMLGGPTRCDPPMFGSGSSFAAVTILADGQSQGRVEFEVASPSTRQASPASLVVTYGLDVPPEGITSAPDGCLLTVHSPDGKAIGPLAVSATSRALSQPVLPGVWTFVITAADPSECLYQPIQVRADLVAQTVGERLSPLLLLGLCAFLAGVVQRRAQPQRSHCPG